MIALILAAGYGTRLYPLTKDLPKALLPVKERTILDHLVEKLDVQKMGIEKIVLVSNHKYAEKFRQWGKSARLDAPPVVLDDGSLSEADRLGSVGDMVFAIRAEQIDKDLLVLGSDNLFCDPLDGFVQFARMKSPAITLGAYELPDRRFASHYGVLTTAGEKVIQLDEKPSSPSSSLISTAVYFFPRRTVGLVLEYVGLKKSADTLGSFIHWLLSRESVFAYPFRGPWFDIGDAASYTHAQESFK